MPDEKIVYHYTNQPGLIGILQDRKLWASSVHHLNDPTEFSVYRIAQSEWKSRMLKAEEAGDTLTAILYREVKRDFDRHIDSTEAYVASFSTCRDTLEQWRGYCPDLGGYAIGFRMEVMKERWDGFWEVKYKTQNEIEDQVHGIFAQMEETFDGWLTKRDAKRSPGFVVDTDESEFVNLAMICAMDTVPKLVDKILHTKDAHYSTEEECRVTIAPSATESANVKWRVGKSHVIPYVELCLDPVKDVIAEVIVGPTPHMDRAVSALQATKFASSIKVVKSAIPYVAW